LGSSADKRGTERAATAVLIAESDRALAELYRETLEADGWRVDLVSDMATLLEHLRRAPPAVLLVNTLPDADQVSAAERVRSMPGTERLVIIVLFDSFDHLDTARLARLNVQAWLSKTRTTREKLSETIANLVGSTLRGQP
jgi:DNA-binding response OmpR family regulator